MSPPSAATTARRLRRRRNHSRNEGGCYGPFFVGPDQGGTHGYGLELSPRGEGVWAQPQDTPGDDSADAVLWRNDREVYAAGSTDGGLGAANRGDTDAFLGRLMGSSGGTVWTDQ